MSIVNNTALSRYWDNSKAYIDNFNIPIECAYIAGVTSRSGMSTGTNYRIIFSTTTNSDLCVLDSGLIQIKKAGVYLVCCQGMFYPGNTTWQRAVLRYWKDASYTNTYNISGTNVISETGYSQGLSGSSNPISVPLYYLDTFSANTKIGFTLSVSGGSAGYTGSNISALLLKIG